MKLVRRVDGREVGVRVDRKEVEALQVVEDVAGSRVLGGEGEVNGDTGDGGYSLTYPLPGTPLSNKFVT